MRAIIVLTLIAALAGCAGTNFSFDNARKVQIGMTEPQVTQLMGAPYSVVSRGDSQMWVWSHANGMTGSAKSVSFEMRDGRVVSVPTIPGSFAGAASTSQVAAAHQPSTPAQVQPLSRQAYKDQQIELLMQKQLPYEEYMRQMRAIETE